MGLSRSIEQALTAAALEDLRGRFLRCEDDPEKVATVMEEAAQEILEKQDFSLIYAWLCAAHSSGLLMGGRRTYKLICEQVQQTTSPEPSKESREASPPVRRYWTGLLRSHWGDPS